MIPIISSLTPVSASNHIRFTLRHQGIFVYQSVLVITAVLVYMAHAASASANTQSPFYIGAHGELSFMQDTQLDIGGTDVGDLEHDLEYAVGLSVGYSPQMEGRLSQTRLELEIMYRESDFDELDGGTIAPEGVGGSIESYVGMVNGYYDFDTGSEWLPYLGAGLGVAQHKFDSLTINVADEDTALAYQGMAGVAYKLSSERLKNALIGVGYRYFGTADPNFSTTAGQSMEYSYDGHNLEAFIRIPF